jgi:hypothetical protein
MVPLLPVAELLSFLKQTSGPWTERDISRALNLSSPEAKQAVAAMQLQGYIEPIGRSQKWRTTEEGQTVSGAKTPRLTRKAVEQALSTLADRIRATNDDPSSLYSISEAVAFGNFFSGEQARVQVGDVGIELRPRNADSEISGSAMGHRAEQAFLKQLRGKSAALHLRRSFLICPI